MSGRIEMRVKKTIQMKCGQAYVVALEDDEHLLEMGDVFLPNEIVKGTRPYRFEDFGEVSDANKRVMTICTMVGCCGSCSFCSVHNTYKRKLSAAEIVGQVDFLINEGLQYGRGADPLESTDFHVLYTRMGEPSLNAESVIESIYTLVDRYPHIQIGLSTFGWRKGAMKFLDHPRIAKHIMLQFSTHGTDEQTRSKLFGLQTGDKLMGLEEIADFIKTFRRMNPRMVSLNFILFEGVNYEFCALKRYFGVEDIYLRLSPLNVTQNSADAGLVGLLQEEDVLRKEPVSSRALKDLMANIRKTGFAYAFAPAIDEEIRYQAACGQALEMMKNNGLITFPSHARRRAAA